VPGVQSLTTGAATSSVQRDPSGGLLALITGAGTTGEYYYVLDGQSSVIGLVDAAGTERARYTYDPYGGHDTAAGVNGALPDNPFRYDSGRAVATDATNHVQLYQFGERFYGPVTGRWTQQDNLEHLGDPAQGNRYAFVGGDPVDNVDLTGRVSGGTIGAIGLGVVGAGIGLAVCGATAGLGCLAIAGVIAGGSAAGGYYLGSAAAGENASVGTAAEWFAGGFLTTVGGPYVAAGLAAAGAWFTGE
jgi:RHS repeat-associated protein